jgi:hypothetical protein
LTNINLNLIIMSEEELNLFLDAYYSIEEIEDEDELFN